MSTPKTPKKNCNGKRPAIIVPSNDPTTPTPPPKIPKLTTPKIDTIYKPKGKLPSNRTEAIMDNLSIAEIEAKVFECKYIQSCVNKRMETIELYLKKRKLKEELDPIGQVLKEMDNCCDCKEAEVDYWKSMVEGRDNEIKELELELSSKNTYISTLIAENERLEKENRFYNEKCVLLLEELKKLKKPLSVKFGPSGPNVKPSQCDCGDCSLCWSRVKNGIFGSFGM